MSQSEPIAEVPSVDDPLHVPRFNVFHAAIWLAATVVLLAIYVAADTAYGRTVPQVGPWTAHLLQGVCAAVFGAALVGAGILVRFSRVATFNRLQPGHWLIINWAIVGLLGMLAWPSWRGNPTELTTNMFIGTAICTMVTGLLYCYVAMQLNYVRRWKTFFGFAAATSFLSSAFTALMIQPDILRSMPIMLLDYGFILFGVAFVMCQLVTVTMFLVAIVIDLREKCRRDWLHWMGVILVVILPLISGAWRIARLFALP